LIGFEPRNVVFAEQVQASIDRQKIMTLTGARLMRLAPGECEIHLLLKPKLSQRHGYYHGGTIADSASGYAAFTL